MISLSDFTRHRNQNGQVAIGLIASVVITGAIVAILNFQDRFSSDGQSRMEQIKQPINIRSGLETFITAIRQAEVEYIKHVAINLQCVSANTFLEALVNGTKCVGSPVSPHAPFDVFIDPTAPGIIDKLYEYGDACTIGYNTGCISPTSSPEVVRIGVPSIFLTLTTEKIGGLEFRFSLNRVDLIKKALSVRANVRKPDRARNIFEIEFRDSHVNMAHLDADGKVRQSNPSPNDMCKDTNPAKRLPFSELKLYDLAIDSCKSFSQIGGGTGLTYYEGRYFSFRPSDGQVFDLKEASDPLSPFFQVNESGYVGGTKVFPEYSKDILLNAEDLTIIENQIYYVMGQNFNAAIWALIDPNSLANHSVKVCDLGSMGWGQAYVGLSSKAWSDRLVPETPNSDPKVATFYLKTFSGDILTAMVWPDSPTTFKCVVLKDVANQVDENKRTMGFDKVVTDKSFSIW